MSLCLLCGVSTQIWWGSNPRSSDHSCVRSSDHSCVKLMASYHEIASRSCVTAVGELSCSRSCDRPPHFYFMISGFRVLNSGIYASLILVIFIDMIYRFLCIGEFVCH